MFYIGAALVIERKGKMKRKQPFWVRLFSPVRLKTQRIYVAGSHPRVRLTAFNIFVGIGSFLIAFIFGSLLLIPGDSSAEESIVTLSNDPALAVAITPENLNLSITPTPSGALSADELNINVNTDNETGYVMSLASANETTDLTDVSTSNSIHSTAATTDNPAVLSANTWGWYPDSLANNPGGSNYQFAAIPSYDDPYTLKQTNTATSDSGDNIPVSIAAKVDTSLPAGAYSNIITITTITNYVPRPILDIYPTTGWTGDTITLYSNDGFINVTSVTVGGTECTSINLVSQDELQCVLPDKAETNPDSDNGYNITVTASGTELDTHNFTIRYFNPSRTETASVSNTQIANINMGTFTSIDCGSLSVGDIVSLTDERNGQTYRIKKMQDEKCWMVDNMKYKGEGITVSNIGDGTEGITLNDTDGRYNTVDGTNSTATSGTGANWDKAFYNNPMVASYCYGDSIQSSYTKCGYLYNWYAATAGSGTYNASTEGTNVAGSICPTGWRLPSGTSSDTSPTASGTSIVAADYAVLDASMNSGSLSYGFTPGYYVGWQFGGAWSGVFAGAWVNNLGLQGSSGYYWSSTNYSTLYATHLSFTSSDITLGHYSKYGGSAVRCVKDGAATITYDGNGADNGSMDTQLIAVGDTQNLLGNTYTRTGYEFIGWNTAADGSGQSYNDGDSYTVSANPDNYYPTLYAQWKKLTFACTARYKLQNADGSYPSNFTTVTVSDAIEYGEVCSYTTTQDSSQYTNQSAQATVTGPTVLTVGTDGQVPRRTYNLTVTAGSNTSGATGSGTYRYGQTVTASVTKATNTTCTSYATPTWSKNSGATGTLSSTSGTSITYTMGTTNDTITATSASGNINQTITFYTTGGASSITLNGTSRTNGQTMSIACGTYSLTGSFNTNYEFSSWSKSGSGSIANTGTLSTTYTVNGTGSITLNGKSSIPPTPTGYMQDFTPAQCLYYANSSNYTLRDRRDNNTYTVRYINGNCWMTQNLRLAGGTTLTSTYSNVSSSYTIPTTDLTSGGSYTDGRIHNSGNTTTGYWYNYCAASAGTVCSDTVRQDATFDICPKGWRLPTKAEFGGITTISYISAFSPVTGGYYYNDGSLVGTSNGFWWSSTAYRNNAQYSLYRNGSGGSWTSVSDKDYGFYVRCIRSS